MRRDAGVRSGPYPARQRCFRLRTWRSRQRQAWLGHLPQYQASAPGPQRCALHACAGALSSFDFVQISPLTRATNAIHTYRSPSRHGHSPQDVDRQTECKLPAGRGARRVAVHGARQL
ncbi:protein of unknown function [Cupriavidus taiwanensis]|nr:protein of unknown function [Cupriavidus taiwanensis]